MFWELILKIHAHQNKIVLEKGLHKLSTLSFRNFKPPSPPVCAHTLLAYKHTQTHTHTRTHTYTHTHTHTHIHTHIHTYTHIHTHTLVRAYGSYILKKIWHGYILWININQRTTNSVREATVQSYRKMLNQNTKDLWDWLFCNETANLRTYV